MNNGYAFLTEVLSSREEFKDLKLNGTILSYNGKQINLKNINIDYLLNQNPRFKKELPNLNPEAIFNILKLHLDYTKAENAKQEKKAKEYIDSTPLLKQFAIVKRTDSEKNEYNYIHYKDSNGINHILEGCNYKDLFECYKTIMQNDSMLKTDKEIYELLKEKHNELVLEDLATALVRPNVTEQHLNNLRKIREDNANAMVLSYEVLGNEQHHIYINNGKVITIDQDTKGKVIEQKHDTDTKENDVIDSITIQDEIELISFNEYVNLIWNKEYLTNDEKDKIKAFESFLFDIITYKDYLTPELYEIYERWADFYQRLYYVPVQTEVIQETLKNYTDMQERSEKVVKTNHIEEVMKLERKNPDKKVSGYVSATVYIILIIAIGFVVGALLFIAS